MNSTLTATRYRVLATTTIGFVDPNVDVTVKWEGTDIDQLSRAFPPSDVFGADDLFQKEIEDGFIITRFTFERSLADDIWEETKDPRRRLTPITAYERAIDEENRRLYPGDYITECQDCGYDECRCRDNEVNCTTCDDHGCAKCDPNWCKACDNDGCAICEPMLVCPGCKQYDPYGSFGKDSGLCQSCMYAASLKYCHQCQGELDTTNEIILCKSCEYYLLIKCSECDSYLPDGNDGLCALCRKYLATPYCPNCSMPHTDPNKSNDDMCQQCEDGWKESYKQSTPLWQRVFWACKYRWNKLFK